LSRPRSSDVDVIVCVNNAVNNYTNINVYSDDCINTSVTVIANNDVYICVIIIVNINNCTCTNKDNCTNVNNDVCKINCTNDYVSVIDCTYVCVIIYIYDCVCSDVNICVITITSDDDYVSTNDYICNEDCESVVV